MPKNKSIAVMPLIVLLVCMALLFEIKQNIKL
jgi:hypothetical protein